MNILNYFLIRSKEKMNYSEQWIFWFHENIDEKIK